MSAWRLFGSSLTNVTVCWFAEFSGVKCIRDISQLAPLSLGSSKFVGGNQRGGACPLLWWVHCRRIKHYKMKGLRNTLIRFDQWFFTPRTNSNNLNAKPLNMNVVAPVIFLKTFKQLQTHVVAKAGIVILVYIWSSAVAVFCSIYICFSRLGNISHSYNLRGGTCVCRGKNIDLI